MLFCAFSVKASTEVLLDIRSENPAVDEEFNVDIIVKPDQSIDTVAIETVTWDRDLLELVKVEQGNLFNGSLVWIDGDISKGMLTGMCWGSEYSTDSMGKFATLVFKGKTDGYSMISLDEVGVASAGLDVPVVKHGCYAMVGTPEDVNLTGDNNGQPIQLPIFLIVTVIIIILVLVYLLKIRGRKGSKP